MLTSILLHYRPDRHVGLFGSYYDPSKWRPSVPFVEQLQAFQELINEGKVMDFCVYVCVPWNLSIMF